jgi:hypothetical protein
MTLTNTSLNDIKNNESTLREKGILKVSEIVNANMLLLELNDFKYFLTKAIPVLTGKNS